MRADTGSGSYRSTSRGRTGSARVEAIGDGAFAVRLGLRYVKGLREEVAKASVAARAERPFASATEVALRVCLDRAERETLAAIGAFASLRGTRRQNVWTLAAPPAGPLFATVQSEHPPEAGKGAPAVVNHSPLPEMSEIERLEARLCGDRRHRRPSSHGTATGGARPARSDARLRISPAGGPASPSASRAVSSCASGRERPRASSFSAWRTRRGSPT